MEIVAIAGLTFDVLATAIMVTICIFAAWYLGAAIGTGLANVLQHVPGIGDQLANTIRSWILDINQGIYNALRGWYNATVQPWWNMMTEIAENQRHNAWQNYNAQSETVHAIGYIYGNTVGAPSTTTQPAVQTALNAAIVKLESEIVTAEVEAVTNANNYTYSIGQWAYGGFLSDEQAIGQTIDALNQEAATRAAEIAQTVNLAVTVAGQAASVALTESQRELQQVSDLTQNRIDYVESSLSGAIANETQERTQQLHDINFNLAQFETGMGVLLTTSILPVVGEIEKVGFKCLDNLCGGLDNIAEDMLDLENLFEIGAMAALISAAVRDPEGAAKTLGGEIQDFLDLGVNLARNVFGV